jgi:hypothetical protein
MHWPRVAEVEAVWPLGRTPAERDSLGAGVSRMEIGCWLAIKPFGPEPAAGSTLIAGHRSAQPSQGIVHLDAQAGNGALQLRVPEQLLDCPKVLGPSIDQGRRCAPHCVGAKGRRVEADLAHPRTRDPRVPSRGSVTRRVRSAGNEEVLGSQTRAPNPGRKAIARRLRDLQLHGSLGILLHGDRPLRHTVVRRVPKVASRRVAQESWFS